MATVIRGVTYAKEDQVPNPTDNIVLTADNITLSGDLEINKLIYLKEAKKLDLDKSLKKNDCFVCFSSGSKAHVGKIAFIEDNTSFFAGGFMGIIRANSDRIQPRFLHLFYEGSNGSKWDSADKLYFLPIVAFLSILAEPVDSMLFLFTIFKIQLLHLSL